MKSKKMIIILVVFLLAASFLFTGTAFSGDAWKKGSVTGVSDYSLKIDGLSFLVNEKVVITDYNNYVFEPDLSILRAVDEILYKTKKGEIIEIRILTRAQ